MNSARSHKDFVNSSLPFLQADPNVIGLLAGGSWIGDRMDEFSDVDLILITEKRTSDSKEGMLEYARGMGTLLNAFTGEHVGEHRMLICLYQHPLLHVDIKFLQLHELHKRVEDPVIVWAKDERIAHVMELSEAIWPPFHLQWVEDRFWTWVHYAALKLGRGEYFEAHSFLDFIRSNVISPMMQVHRGEQPRSLRRVEEHLQAEDLRDLKETLAAYEAADICRAIDKCIEIYLRLRPELANEDFVEQEEVQRACLAFYHGISGKLNVNA